ncbi:MAG: signal peptidase II [Acidobacteriota bacterium]
MGRDEATSDSERSSEAQSASGGMATMRHKWRYLLISLATLVLDQWSKWLVEAHLSNHASIEVIPGLLNFTHVRNTGVAFGFFATHGNATGTLILSLLGLAALIFVGYYFWMVPREDRTLLVALALVIGGAVGNLADRLMQGAVTDFVDFYYGTYHWHTFNVADTAISIGIGLMILGTFRAQPAPRAAASEKSEDGASAVSS